MTDANEVSPMSQSIRIRAVLVVICASTVDGRTCGASSRFEHDEAEEAIGMARSAGWTFRNKAARCPSCGRRGASFGRIER